MDDKIMNLLSTLGFTSVEAAAYVALLKEPGATGYRISRLIDKPVPNTYKALDSLKEKGAVVMDDSSGSRSYAPLSIHEYLDGVRRNLSATQDQIEHELKNLTAAPMEGGIYQLNSAEQVYERCRTMLREAKSVVLFDAFPKPLEILKPDLEKAAKRGVHILILGYGPTEVAGCEVIAPRKEVPDLAKWDGDWLNVAVDCSGFMYSLIKLDGRGVHRSVWSRDVYLAVLAYNGMLNEQVLRRVFQMLHFGKTKDEIRQEVQRMSQRYVSETPFDRVISPWRRVLEPREEIQDKPGTRSRKGPGEPEQA
jgi:HTH-type transcriptional regulator, sugar sensing transcriptional regulator